MTRDEILQSYEVARNGLICSPGKFEGEMLYMPHFYEVMLDGFSEALGAEGEEIEVCKVTDKDRAEFPELGATKLIAFYIRADGFVCECDLPDRKVEVKP